MLCIVVATQFSDALTVDICIYNIAILGSNSGRSCPCSIVFDMLACLAMGVMLSRPIFENAVTVKKMVDAVIARDMKEHSFAGISVAVGKNGKIVYETGYGLASLENSTKATAQTVYHTCSIGKHMTAAGVLKLVEQGKLSLSDDLDKYVPSFSGRGITIGEMLSHTSGLGDFSVTPEFVARERQEWSRDEMAALIAKQPMLFDPSKSWAYSNSAFYLLGLVIEKASGERYYPFMQKNVWRPAGMHVFNGGSDAVVPHFAYGYAFVDGKPVKADPISWQPVFSAGGMCCTASDLVRYEMALEAGKVLSRAKVDEMRSPYRISDGVAFDYGLGTRRGFLGEHAVVGHTGGGAGYTTVLMSFPADHLVIAVMQNCEGGYSSTRVATEIARSLLHLGEDKPKDLAVRPDILKLHFGVYRSEDGEMEVFVKNGKLRYRPKGSQDAGIAAAYQGGYVFSSQPNFRERLVVQGDQVPFIQLYQGPMFGEVAVRE